MKSFVPIVAALLLVGACDAAPDTAAQLLARQQALDPPRLWRIETLADGGKIVGVSFVCADTPLSQTFARVHAEVGGTPCRTRSGPVTHDGLSTLRCIAQGWNYEVSSQTSGDLTRDFRLAVTVIPLGRDLGSGRQLRRFQRLGACPSGWRIGDQADARRQPGL